VFQSKSVTEQYIKTIKTNLILRMSKMNKDFLECVQEARVDFWNMKVKNLLITSLLITSPTGRLRITQMFFWS
jgi:hypothetical protein